jgi:hypothetical protein
MLVRWLIGERLVIRVLQGALGQPRSEAGLGQPCAKGRELNGVCVRRRPVERGWMAQREARPNAVCLISA